MQVIVESKNLEVTKAIREFAEKQARKLSKLSGRITRIRLFLETIPKKRNDPHANTVTYEVEVPGKNVVITSKAVDMYEAIVAATNTAARRMRKQFEKKITKRRSKIEEE
ncbi:MAG: ribosomal subunit interface protein [Candidatus Pacebacteria bacterium CG10_big_fil_rev_8_21_14_0_10_42_12]|nr:ribosome-associated translation inhibitor RaiA [Candidatus Paceibacterota bacterium]PIR62238.1 MAG: ribosomal subunit interface protein [Candidatus Pacebacteria bacterium CG10_big_fil_rev_8_21_14_0_10_42_12]